MDSVRIWAEKIARTLVPDEIDQSPFVAEDFVKGGKARKVLFQQAKGGEIGALGGEVTMVLPFILRAIEVAAPFLYGVLASGVINNSISLVKEIIAARENWERKHQKQTDHQHMEDAAKAALLDPNIKQSIESMTHDLQSAGLTPEKSEHISYRIILLFSEDVPGALSFLQKVTEKK
jgi:hypothetical protein